jgi:hypothetical protein
MNVCNKKASESVEKTLPPMTDLERELADEALGDARKALSSAMIFALATRAEEAEDLMIAFGEQVDLTAKIHEAGLLPRGLSMTCKAGPFPPALVWIEKNIDRLLADPNVHPVFRQWAELNDERHRIKHLLPTLN